jgi:hypothetical protein
MKPGTLAADQTPVRTQRRRQALSQTAGPVTTRGDREVAATLAAVMTEAEHGAPDRWTHGFHVYPARMHPAIARAACARWVERGMTVLDPFCGSGTVALEAMAGGAKVIAADLNPLAIRLAKLKCTRMDDDARARLGARVDQLVEEVLGSVRARVEVLAPLSPEERAHYEPHVLRELAVLHRDILAIGDRRAREVLTMVFSAIVGKFSRQRADTRDEAIEKHIGKGVPTRFFGRKAHELIERFAALEAELSRGVSSPKWLECDVRDIGKYVAPASVDLVLTSPPYVGTYDYVDHHARRWAWLGLQPRRLRRGELGARRDYANEGSHERWDRELGAVLGSLARVLGSGAWMLWLVGDGEIAGRRIDAAAQLAELAPKRGLHVVASAAQARPDWRGGKARAEHLVAMRRI